MVGSYSRCELLGGKGEHCSVCAAPGGYVHALTGNDVTSRISTKHAAMQCNPIVYLTEFDNRVEILETVIAQVEEYLLLGWAGAKSKP